MRRLLMTDDTPVDWPRRSETQPVPWELLDQIIDRVEQQCIRVFESHTDELSGFNHQECVSYLYNTWKEEYGDETSPEQGAVYLFAYLVEKHGISHPSDDAFGIGSVVDRKPAGKTLRKLFETEEKLPWWIAVQLGVHYTLVNYWLREEDIPYMRRNIPEDILQQIDAIQESTK